jgi:hypothetical protein
MWLQQIQQRFESGFVLEFHERSGAMWIRGDRQRHRGPSRSPLEPRQSLGPQGFEWIEFAAWLAGATPAISPMAADTSSAAIM